ncbi:MAG TPA: rhamnogalacturonan acetylesterase [Rariglobus sp.]
MKFKFLPFLVLPLSAAFALEQGGGVASVPSGPPAIALIGDSTVCDYPLTGRMRGWGQLLPEYLQAGVAVRNEAKGGLSTKTFPRDRWRALLASHPDYVLIQFGHNDSHAKDRPESTDAATDYAENLRHFVAEARAAGVTPILVTPVRRRLFKQGKTTEELAPYAESMRGVAEETKTLLVDLHAMSGDLYARLGETDSTPFTLNATDQADRPGLGDRTHFTEYGARRMARLVAEGISKADTRLSAWIRLPAEN